jgi:hypothetical protein
MIKRTFLLLAILLLPAPRTQAYYDDVHYALTYYVARQSGYTHLQAYRIASLASMVDWDPETEPVQAKGQGRLLAQGDSDNGLIDALERAWRASKYDFQLRPLHLRASDPRWKFHAFRHDMRYPDGIGFGSEASAAQGAVIQQVNALFQQALNETKNPGVFMHAFQDIEPHNGYGTAWGHNPFTPDTFARHLKNKLTVGSTTDWVSSRVTHVNFLCQDTNRYLTRFMAAVSPHQHQRAFYIDEYTPLIALLARINPAPQPIKTDLQRQLFIRHYARKSGVDLDDYPQYLSTLVNAQQLSTIASDLGIGLSQEDYEKHKNGPDIVKAVKALNGYMKNVGISEELPEHHIPYDLDEDGRLANEFQADDWVLTGSLLLTTAGKPATATLKMHVRDARGASTLTPLKNIPPRAVSPGTQYRWDNLPIGDLVIEFKLSDGRTVRKDLVLKKRVNEAHFLLGEAAASIAGLWDVTVNYQNFTDRLRWNLYNEGRQAAGFYITRTLVSTDNPARQRFVGQSLGQTDIRPLPGNVWQYEQTGGATWYKATCTFSGDFFTCSGSTWSGTEPITIKGTRSGAAGSPPPSSPGTVDLSPGTPQIVQDVWGGIWDVDLYVANVNYVLRWESRKVGTSWRILQTILSTDNPYNQVSVGYKYEATIDRLPDGSYQFSSTSAAGITPGMAGYFRQVARCSVQGDRMTCKGTQEDSRSPASYQISFSGVKAGGRPTN